MIPRFLASKVLALVWLLLVTILLCLAWLKQPSIDTSMMSLLPESQQQPLVREASAQMGQRFAERLLILVSGADKSALQQATQFIAERFDQVLEIESVVTQVDNEDLEHSQQVLNENRYVLLSDEIRTDLQNDDSETVRKRALSMIFSPMQIGDHNLKTDPFALSAAWRLSQSPSINLEIDEQGFIVLPEESGFTHLLMLQLKDDAFSIHVQRAVLTVLKNLKAELSQQNIELSVSGLLVHADAGTRQAEQEISTIGVGSLIGILLLMLWVFKKIRLVAILFIPILIGCAVATSVAFLVFDRVHIVTFAFGAGLIGVSIDYALHFICERQQHHSVLTRIMPGLCLGLFSSVLAYAALAVTPFPGLRQMAVFSAVGLIAAWLTVVLWLPKLTKNDPLNELMVAKRLAHWQSTIPSLIEYGWFKVILAVLVILSITSIWTGQAEDDIRLLQTSPAQLLEQEADIQTRLGLNSSTQFLLNPCEVLEQCLQKEEQLKPRLNKLLDDGILSDFTLLSDRLPSFVRQTENANLVESLYNAELSALFSTLNLPEKALHDSMALMLQGLTSRLTVDDLSNNSIGGMLSSQIIHTQQNGFATMISLTASQPTQLAKQLNLTGSFPYIVLVDQVEAISSLMANYRQQIMILVALAYVLVFVILLVRYKIAALGILMPPMLASLFTLGLLMQILPGINLFHIMALILVLGIGLDMGIFLAETHQAANTWLAVTLSVITSLLAFGLLSISQTPVLHHFGLTIFLGLAMVWLLTMLCRQPLHGVQ